MDKKGRKKLAELAVNGDTDAFSKLYGEIYKELYYYALANLQNAEDAADAVQDAVLDGHHLPPLQPRGLLAAEKRSFR